MPPSRFPLTLRKVKQVWDGTQNPLDLLNPGEIKAAELYVSIAHNPKVTPRTAGVKVARVSFARVFEDHFGFELHDSYSKSLFKNPAWIAYVQMLQTQTKETVLAKLEAGAMDAFHRYQKAGELAESADDHKEMRLWATDYLDRVGATRKTSQGQTPGNSVTIVLKGLADVSHAQLLKQLPAVEAEIVEEDG